MRGLHTSADDNMADVMQKFTYCDDYRRCDGGVFPRIHIVLWPC